jgi:YD repeat-containing protein
LNRNEPGLSYTQYWDHANRLTDVTGSATANFKYDGDGNRVKATVNGVAMNDNGTVYYLLGDYLGSGVL